MSTKIPFDADPVAGITRTFYYDPVTEQCVIETEQQVDDIIDASKGAFNAHDERAPWTGDLHRVASIPMSVFMDLKQRGIADDPAALRRWLNDPDNRVFRTRPGRV